MVLEETKPEEPGSPTQLALPEAGAVLDGRYRIGRPLGSGGMGAVFEATNESVKRRCAVKFLRVELAGRSRSLKRFEREARLLGGLVHDNLTAVIDFGFYSEISPYFVMEYVEGITLRTLLGRSSQLPVVQVLELAEQICRGVAHAHEHGIIHRDLKPENLMLAKRSDGTDLVKILDFGIAREVAGDQEGTLTPAGADLGTPHYMSPEQARGEDKIDARSDVYSLGVILYEAITGVKAHPGDTYNQVIFHLLTETPRSIKQIRPDCPPALRELIERCMHPVAGRRYADGQDLLKELCELNAPMESVPREPSNRSDRFWLGTAIGASIATIGISLQPFWGHSEPKVEVAHVTVASAHDQLEEEVPILKGQEKSEDPKEVPATPTELPAIAAEDVGSAVKKENAKEPQRGATNLVTSPKREPVKPLEEGHRDGYSFASENPYE